MKVNYKDKSYTHFDYRTHYQDYENLVCDSKWVEHHGFYPFVHSVIDRSRYSRRKGRISRTRDIYYASHVDSYIYQYYGSVLNNAYNEYAQKLGIQENAIAYRNCWGSKNNIHFAREVFDFICDQEMAYVYVTDLKSFFDTLDHSYLKRQIKKTLGVEELDGGNYAVYKSLTAFAYVDRADLEKIAIEKCEELKKMDRFMDVEEFHNRKKELVKTHKEKYGIPQGTSVSAVYANIYMADFDKGMSEYVSRRNGMYRRYCDDIIIVIPIKREDVSEDSRTILQFIKDRCAEVPRLVINEEKTEQYLYDSMGFHGITDEKAVAEHDNVLTYISYLGFDFDGKVVRIRDKSIYKYYYRAYRKIDKVNGLYANDIHKYMAGKKAVYNGYTHLYSPKHAKNARQKHGNFYTYAKRAHEEFSNSVFYESAIKKQLRRHWSKIELRLEGGRNASFP